MLNRVQINFNLLNGIINLNEYFIVLQNCLISCASATSCFFATSSASATWSSSATSSANAVHSKAYIVDVFYGFHKSKLIFISVSCFIIFSICSLQYSMWKLATLWFLIFNVKACDCGFRRHDCDIVIFNIQCESFRLCGFRRHDFDILYFLENLLTSWSFKFCLKLTDIVIFLVLFKTYWHRMFRHHVIDIVVFYVSLKIYWHHYLQYKVCGSVVLIFNMKLVTTI